MGIFSGLGPDRLQGNIPNAYRNMTEPRENTLAETLQGVVENFKRAKWGDLVDEAKQKCREAAKDGKNLTYIEFSDGGAAEYVYQRLTAEKLRCSFVHAVEGDGPLYRMGVAW